MPGMAAILPVVGSPEQAEICLIQGCALKPVADGSLKSPACGSA